MRFKKIKITGFKGFADPVELFLEQGLSGVVGPNGCGKSNLVEAIGWVMGENRPTVMRAGSMDDVIFNGAASRPAHGHAEVVLSVTIDRPLPVSLGGGTGDVEISRRIDRNGSSVFRINGREVRRRDVQLLFADSSTGSRSTALVRQGQVAELINASPIGRSAILENAAGISGLHQRRHEAELKLASTERNLARVMDLVDQLRKNRDALRRQAGQTRRYRKISDRLQQLEMMEAHRNWVYAEREAVEAKSALARKTTELSGLKVRATKARTDRDRRKEQLEPLLDRQSAAQTQLQRKRMELEKLDDDYLHSSRTIASLYSQLCQIDKDLVRERELESDGLATIKNLETSYEELANSGASYSEQMAEAKRLCASAVDRYNETESRYEDMNRQQIQVRTLQQEAGKARDRLSERIANIVRELKGIGEQIATTDASRVSAARDFAEAGTELKAAESNVATAEAELEAAEQERVHTISALESCELAHSESLSRLRVHESEAGNLARLLEAEIDSEQEQIRAVTVDQGYELALGAALGDDLFIGAVDAERTHGWVEIANVNEPDVLPEGVESLSGHVRAPRWLNRRLGQIGIASLDDARAMQHRLAPGQRLVTVEGDVIRWDGLIVSNMRMQGRAAQRLTQINRLGELGSLIEDDRENSARTLDDLESTRRDRDRISNLCADKRRNWHEAERVQARCRERVADARSDLAMHERNLDSLVSGRDSLQFELTEFEQELAQDAHQASGAGWTGEQQDDLEAAKKAFDDARSVYNERQMDCVELQQQEESRTRRMTDLKGDISNWKDRNERARERIDELEERRKHFDREHRNALQLPEHLDKQRDDLVETIDRLDASGRHLTDQIATVERAHQDESRNEQELNRQLQEVREDRVRAEMNEETARNNLVSAADAIFERYDKSPESLADIVNGYEDVPERQQALEEAIAGLRRKREAIGAVNLRAESDMKELQEELDGIIGEKEEIEAAIGKIRDSISKLNREGKSRLTEAFENVRANFQLIFTGLFEGGKADLELIEGEDPLCNGLEIRCHPPGKRQTTLSLMSGGEQTLTSLALIFAFFLTNSSPVCVLDEVDSPLDDANVLRLCNLLDDIVRKTGTRFMIVTHNAITMSRMNRLYGITMQEKGVSQIVQVDLGQAEQLAA